MDWSEVFFYKLEGFLQSFSIGDYHDWILKIKEQTRKLAAGCSKHRFEVVDRTDEVSNIYTAR
ncbi:hypothetical protein [Streptococcus pneumoniae]|uniref:hypothetical protein n=1 Tax=Streptococcus pneumoniae TaxID=1313 RepID=UPI000A4E7990|nr:hypothetical protein [Streptococcus pneumoniae]